MKVALLNDTLGRSRGGVEAWMHHAADGLDALGHGVVLAALDANERPADAAPPHVDVHWLAGGSGGRLPGVRTLRRLRQVSRQLARITADVDAFWCRSPLMARCAARIADGRPVVFIMANALSAFYAASGFGRADEPRLRERLLRRAAVAWVGLHERKAMAAATALAFLSRARMEETLDACGRRFAAKGHVTPPGIDLRRFCPGGPRDASRPLQTLTVCRLSLEKNLPLLIDAAALLAREGLEVRSTIVGDGPLRDQLQRQIDEAGLTGRVVLAGRSDCVEQAYRQADVFVLPSTYEGFGHVYLEAFASGIPAIALAAPGLRVAAGEIIEPGRTGLLLEENSPAALADALRWATGHRHRLAVWGRNARLVCETRYRWEQAVARLIGITFPAAANALEGGAACSRMKQAS